MEAHVEELGTKLGDAAWFTTAFAEGRYRPDPAEADLWALRFTRQRVRWRYVAELSAVAVVLADAGRGVVVGVWAEQRVCAPDEALAVARSVARSVG